MLRRHVDAILRALCSKPDVVVGVKLGDDCRRPKPEPRISVTLNVVGSKGWRELICSEDRQVLRGRCVPAG